MGKIWEKYLVKQDEKVKIKDWDTSYDGELTKDEVYNDLLPANKEEMSIEQDKLFADNSYALLIVVQAMDAAGKDGLIRRVFNLIDPQGLDIQPFKKPTSEELDHDYLWRVNKALPERGKIGIFNRSHYEDVLVSRIHDLLDHDPIPDDLVNKGIWKQRYEQINNWEKYLTQNGIVVLKFFLNVSFEEQTERLLSRIDRPEKNWKFQTSDVEERFYWKEYMDVYGEMISKTSKDYAPWFIIPADRKWYARYAVSEIVLERLKMLGLKYPEISKEQKEAMEAKREVLLKQKP